MIYTFSEDDSSAFAIISAAAVLFSKVLVQL